MCNKKGALDEEVLHREEGGDHDRPPAERDADTDGASGCDPGGKRSRFSLEALQTAAAIGSVIVAVAALIFAFGAEKRSSGRFQQQLDQAERIARSNVQPLLIAHTHHYVNRKGVFLANHGIGPAIITSVRISRENRIVGIVPKLLDLDSLFDREVIWDDFASIDTAIIKNGEKVDLVLLSMRNLGEQGFSDEQQATIMEEFERQMDGISIRVEYEDILGSRQDPYEITLEAPPESFMTDKK